MSTPLPLRLPRVAYDENLDIFSLQLAEHARISGPLLALDFQDVEFYTPGPLTALVSFVRHQQNAGRTLELLNLQHAPARSYLQRIDFIRHCGITLPENFRRLDPAGRFVPIRRIDASLVGQVDKVAGEVADCLFPEQAAITDYPEQTGPYDLVVYAATELINNVLQHARAEGFLLAQTYPKQGIVRLAIADAGIGIRGSFQETKPDFWDPAMNDLDAVRLALKPRVSSKLNVASAWGAGVNAGVGLSILKELAHDTDGIFSLVSHAGFFQFNHIAQHEYPSELLLSAPWLGTLCAVQVAQPKLIDHQRLLRTVKHRLRLLDDSPLFDDLFEP